jgi:hypothetical protein
MAELREEETQVQATAIIVGARAAQAERMA